MEKLVSIIVPVYNVEKYLRKCIESLLNQTYKNIEVILVDDGSTDNSLAICNEFANKDNRIVVLHKENGGQSSARNFGLNVANGEYIGFVDSDDYVHANMYEYLMKLITDNNVKVAQIQSYSVDENYNVLNKDESSEGKLISASQYTKSILEFKGTIAVWASIFEKKVIGDLRFDESKLNEDLLFMYALMQKCDNIYISQKKLYYYLQRNNSTSRSGFNKCIIDCVDNAIYIYNDLVNNNKVELAESAKFLMMKQFGTYLYLIPRAKMQSEHCQMVIAYLKANKAMLKHKLLDKKTKYILKLFLFAPSLAKKLCEIYFNRNK